VEQAPYRSSHPGAERKVLKAGTYGRPYRGADEKITAQAPPQGPGPSFPHPSWVHRSFLRSSCQWRSTAACSSAMSFFPCSDLNRCRNLP